MSLLQSWREMAYSTQVSKAESDRFWQNYFVLEQGIYEKILADRDNVVEGTVAELAKKFDVEEMIMVGFLDGINDSLKNPNPIEEMTLETVVNLGYDDEKLYYNMVEARAEWLYNLPQWDDILTVERRAELYKEQKASGTVRNENKVGRNDPCPCGSGKKYKFCCLNKK